MIYPKIHRILDFARAFPNRTSKIKLCIKQLSSLNSLLPILKLCEIHKFINIIKHLLMKGIYYYFEIK